MHVRFVTFVLLHALLFSMLVRLAVGAELPIPSISIPPGAQYLAQRIVNNYHSLCSQRPRCIEPLEFGAGTQEGHVLSLLQGNGDDDFAIIDDTGPYLQGVDGKPFIIRTVRRTAIISASGTIKYLTEATSSDDFQTVTDETVLSWRTAIGLLDFVDQLLVHLADERNNREAR